MLCLCSYRPDVELELLLEFEVADVLELRPSLGGVGDLSEVTAVPLGWELAEESVIHILMDHFFINLFSHNENEQL